eukprot:GHVN01082308.1.p1 GENE.GHVN01082308.1~~GHVN01082308.1.p1  ORF type:complete len:277 (+),score=40.39 GHVN01082308.1:77-907(+)
MLPPNWVEYTSEDGEAYYHNVVTDFTTWDRPSFSDQRMIDMGAGRVGEDPFGGETGTTTSLSGQPVSGKLDSGSRFETEGISENAQSRLRLTDGARGVGVMGAVGTTLCACCDPSIAKSYFKITTQDVTKRLKSSLLPHKGVMTDGENDFRINPDMYGPFWVSTTLAFVIFACGNAHLLAQGTTEGARYSYLYIAACLVYGALSASTVAAVALAMGIEGSLQSLNLPQVVCVAGYAMSVLIPVTLLCLIPVPFLRWVICAMGYVVAGVFIYKNLVQ